MDIKLLKKALRKKTDKHPDKYFPVKTLEQEGLRRYRCGCGRYFWAAQAQEPVCGDCEPYSFIGQNIAPRINYLDALKKFQSFFKKLGYMPIKRYPVVARWRDDIDFVHAAINNFQPYVITGEVAPPANPLTVAQPSLRFNDVDNVGITGRHFTIHNHLEQFTVQKKSEFDQEKYFLDLLSWLTKGLQIPHAALKFHEDAWSGGGNLGTSLEHFSHGLELGNQVYMTYKITNKGIEDLPLKALDMGAGLERYTWLASGSPASYDVVMPTVCKKLYKVTKVEPDWDILNDFMPHAGMLNIDEVEDINKAWSSVAKKSGVEVNKLKQAIKPLSALYSVADHSLALLFALADGALPSNVGGGYNLRSIYRRALDFIREYKWDVGIPEVCKWHAEFLKSQYPELAEAFPEVETILDVEERKYEESASKALSIVATISKSGLSENKLLELYDSHGIMPTLLLKKGLIKSIPADFYVKLAEKHEKTEQKAQTKRSIQLNLKGIPDTIKLYYEKASSKAKVLKVIGNYIVLDQTCFYPTSGGQLCDLGLIDNTGQNDFSHNHVVNVFKQDNHIIHELKSPPEFKVNDTVECVVDKERRAALKQHHTATHLINGAARLVLGEHIWQAGSQVTPERARLDITHYAGLTREEIKKVESKANEYVKKAVRVEKLVLLKDKAEKQYGFRLYQGGAVPGAELRVIKVGDIDVEACGGTHVDNTEEIGKIKITGSKRIQDGVVRLEYVAGKYAEEESGKDEKLAREVLASLGMDADLASSQASKLAPAAKVFSVQTDQLPKTVKRFIEDVKKQFSELKKGDREFFQGLKDKDLPEALESLFATWKRNKKEIKRQGS